VESNSGVSVILRSLLLNQSFNCFICSEIDRLGLLDGPGEDGEGAHVALSERVPLKRERGLEVVGFATEGEVTGADGALAGRAVLVVRILVEKLLCKTYLVGKRKSNQV
jgi:hypothetical protein